MTVLVLVSLQRTRMGPSVRTAGDPLRPVEKVYLPSREVIRKLVAAPTRRSAPSPAPPTPPPAGRRRWMEDIPTPLPPTTPKPPADRMSVGVDAAPRNVGRGQDEKPIQAPGLREAARDAVKEETPSPMAVAGETRPAVAGGTVARRPSLLGSAQRIERELAASGDSGQGKLVHATGQQIGGFFFDPQGADFTAWLNHLRNELYRNWIVPQAALLGYHGEVDIEFTVSRDGTLHDLHVLSSTGTPSLDRAAANALLGSRPLPLPADYAPAELTFRIGFIYNDARGRS